LTQAMDWWRALVFVFVDLCVPYKVRLLTNVVCVSVSRTLSHRDCFLKAPAYCCVDYMRNTNVTLL